MHITPDSLKGMAATNVAAYKSTQTPLNDSIIKVAMENEMNSDQVKRLVETTNQMAYLSELEGQDDRTFEFNVANYDAIMDSIISDPTLEKTASAFVNPMDLVTGCFSNMEKVATEKEATLEKWGKPQKLLALKKVASHQRNRLDELVNARYDTMVKLAQHRAILCRDPEALEKMAKFDNQLDMTKLVFGHEKIATDVRRVWRPEDLADTKALSDRLYMVKAAQEEISTLQPKVEHAEGILKEAFIVGALGRVGIKGAIKNVMGKMPGMKKVKSTSKKLYGGFEAVTGSKEVSDGTSRNFDAWSSLRG